MNLVETLENNIEQRMQELYKDSRLDYEESIIQRAVITALGILIESLRSDEGSSDTPETRSSNYPTLICKECGQEHTIDAQGNFRAVAKSADGKAKAA